MNTLFQYLFVRSTLCLVLFFPGVLQSKENFGPLDTASRKTSISINNPGDSNLRVIANSYASRTELLCISIKNISSGVVLVTNIDWARPCFIKLEPGNYVFDSGVFVLGKIKARVRQDFSISSGQKLTIRYDLKLNFRLGIKPEDLNFGAVAVETNW